VADSIFFNSEYHLTSFTESLGLFLKQFPDHKTLQNIEKIKEKSSTLYLGMDLKKFDDYKIQITYNEPIILWNHRWEYDKNPDLFFKVLCRLKDEKVPFKLIVLGQSYSKSPSIFKDIEKLLSNQIIHFGYVFSFKEYANLLWQSDLLLVTSNQDFFGGSVVEAIYCNCFPILPDRLAYPEHVPKEEYPDHFYKSEEELYKKLRSLVFHFERKQVSEKLKNFVTRYDWSNLAPIYDLTFENLFREFTKK
jgi:glycosyltransferase involved in cell wall biosynthesis